MTDIEQQFREAVEKVQNAPDDGEFQPSNDFKLSMYGLFKQSTDGDVHGKKPGMLDLIGRAKYNAWAGRKGMSKEEAMQAYIAEVDKIESEFG